MVYVQPDVPIFPTANFVLYFALNYIGRKIFSENFSIAKSSILRWYQQVITKGSFVLFIRIISLISLSNHTAAAFIINGQEPFCLISSGLSLSLFVFRILADYSDTSFSLDDFAFFANRFYR